MPAPERPDFHPGYGISTDPPQIDRFPWSRAVERLTDAHNYWITTTRSDGRPHAMPVWAIWHDDGLWFGTNPESVKGRNIRRSPEIVAHLESGDDVVIVEGRIEMVTEAAQLERVATAYVAKYGVDPQGPTPRMVLWPRTVLTWFEADFVTSAVRWRFRPARRT